MRERISLLLPTRGRPDLARRFLASVVECSTHLSDVEVVLCVDDDDPKSFEIDHPALEVRRIVGPRRTMGAYNSDCLAKSRGEIVILVNDDLVIRTQDWDDRVRAIHRSVPDQIYLAYANDLLKKDRLSTFPILSRRTCELLAEPYPSSYRGAFIDYHLMDIFKRLEKCGWNRLNYLPDVVFEHLHYRTGKAKNDDTYRARGRFADDMLFVGLAPMRAAACHRLAVAIRDDSVAEVSPGFLPAETRLNPWRAFRLFIRTFLMDRSLPFGWRFRLWWWFCARYLASLVLR